MSIFLLCKKYFHAFCTILSCLVTILSCLVTILSCLVTVSLICVVSFPFLFLCLFRPRIFCLHCLVFSTSILSLKSHLLLSCGCVFEVSCVPSSLKSNIYFMRHLLFSFICGFPLVFVLFVCSFHVSLWFSLSVLCKVL